MFAFFANLSAAFDKVNRTRLSKMLNKSGISEKLRRKIIEIYNKKFDSH